MEAGINPVTTEQAKTVQKSRDLLARSEAEMQSGNTDFAFSLEDQAIGLAQDLGAEGRGNPFGKDTAIDRTLHANYEMGREAEEKLSIKTMAERQQDYQAMVKPSLVEAARNYVQLAQQAEKVGNEELAEDYEYEAASLARSLGNDGGTNPFDEKQDPMLHRQFYKGVAEVEMLPAEYQEQRDTQKHELSAKEAKPEPFPPLTELSWESTLPLEQRAAQAIRMYEQSTTPDPDMDVSYADDAQGHYENALHMAGSIGLDGHENPFSRDRHPELHQEYVNGAEYRDEQVYRIFGNPSAFEAAQHELTEADKAKLYLMQARLEEARRNSFGADFREMDAVATARALGQTGRENPFSQESTPLLHTAFFSGSLKGNEHNVVLTSGQKSRLDWLDKKEAEWRQAYDEEPAPSTPVPETQPIIRPESHNTVVNDLRHLAETLSDPKKAAKAALIADRMAAMEKEQTASPELTSKLQHYSEKREALTNSQSKQAEQDEELSL